VFKVLIRSEIDGSDIILSPTSLCIIYIITFFILTCNYNNQAVNV